MTSPRAPRVPFPAQRVRHRAQRTPLRARIGLLVATVALAAMMPVSGCAAPAPKPTSFEADLLLNDGPGAGVTEFHVRGRSVTAILPSGLDGAAAGVFRAELAAGDPLLGALAHLPAGLAGPPVVAGMPSITITVRDAGGTHRLVGPRPPTDPWLERVVNGLGRWESDARRHPLLALRAQVVLHGGPQARGAGRVTTQLVAIGGSGSLVADAAALRLEIAPPAPPRQPGITPLPPAWMLAGQGAAHSSSRTIVPNRPLEVPIAFAARGPRVLRAVYAGPVKLTVAGETYAITADLVSTPVPFDPGRSRTKP